MQKLDPYINVDPGTMSPFQHGEVFVTDDGAETDLDLGRDNLCYVHVTLAPYIGPAGELKTKPTQHSVRELRSIGIQPDAIVLRSDRHISQAMKRKIALLCDVEMRAIASAADTDNIYEIPLVLHSEGLDDFVLEHLRIDAPPPDLKEWKEFVARMEQPKSRVRIGLVGKYVDLPDAYLSVIEALKAGGYAAEAEVEIVWVSSDENGNGTALDRSRSGIVPGHLSNGGPGLVAAPARI